MRTILNRFVKQGVVTNFLPFAIILQHLAGVGATGSAGSITRIEREAWVMGTRLRVVVEAADPGRAEGATEMILRDVEDMDRLLSTWDEFTPLSALNAAPAAVPVPVPAELAELLAEAETWAILTNRAFDPTVGALVDAWDLRGQGRTPSVSELEHALSLVGRGGVYVNVAAATATRMQQGTWIDAGAFGKGAALRSAARRSREFGVERALVDLGGQLWAGGSASSPWSVRVAHPRHRDASVARLLVQDVSVATSGTSERGGHILDPRSGRPAPAWGSVTVVARDPLEADILSTALYVMGPDAGAAWARRFEPRVAVLFLEDGPDGIRARWTPAMEQWLVEAPVPGESIVDNINR